MRIIKQKTSENKSFKDWEAEEVEEAFGIVRLQTLVLLDALIAIKANKNHIWHNVIERYRKSANWLIEGWNEDEYKFLFISPFLKLVDFSTDYCNVFTQRPMSVSYENGTKTTQGKVEWMVARGRQNPKQPHFFFHEYKPEKNRDNDPLGQVLIAMVAAQVINSDDKPIYGIYVNGRNWFLLVLQGKQYATSRAYDITSDEIFDLFAILEHLRDKMEALYKALV
jgi:hypothetical protein